MRAKILIITACALSFSTGTLASSFLRPRGEFSTAFFRLEYDPSKGCSKPYRPYRADNYEMDSYRSDAKRYVGCLEEAATSDIQYAQNAVVEGYTKALEDFKSEIQRGY
jgi:hypothetical protein